MQVNTKHPFETGPPDGSCRRCALVQDDPIHRPRKLVPIEVTITVPEPTAADYEFVEGLMLRDPNSFELSRRQWLYLWARVRLRQLLRALSRPLPGNPFRS